MARAPFIRCDAWLPEDDARLAVVWKQLLPVKILADHFPGRTYYAVTARAKHIGLPERRSLAAARADAQIAEAVESAITTTARTIAEIAEVTGIGICRVRRFINRNRAQLHIKNYARSYDGVRPGKWIWGPAKDAPRPPRKTPSEIAKGVHRRKMQQPFAREMLNARQRVRRAIRTGSIVQRDAAAIALFGDPRQQISKSGDRT